LAASQASTYVPDYSKAKLSAKRIFELEDLVPAIDSYSEEGDRPVSTLFYNLHSKDCNTIVLDSTNVHYYED